MKFTVQNYNTAMFTTLNHGIYIVVFLPLYFFLSLSSFLLHCYAICFPPVRVRVGFLCFPLPFLFSYTVPLLFLSEGRYSLLTRFACSYCQFSFLSLPYFLRTGVKCLSFLYGLGQLFSSYKKII